MFPHPHASTSLRVDVINGWPLLNILLFKGSKTLFNLCICLAYYNTVGVKNVKGGSVGNYLKYSIH